MTSVLITQRANRPSRGTGKDPRRRLAVIGNGMAGARAVEEILARGGGAQFTVTIFGDEPYGNYDRRKLSHLLCGGQTQAGILLNPVPWYAENSITLHAGVRVERIDGFTKNVFSSDGRVTPYDTLIIATGSRPYLPALDGLYTPGGSLKQGVFGFRTVDDVKKVLAYVRQDIRRAVVIGAGLPGLHAGAGTQAAHGLRSRGLHVDVVPTVTSVEGADRVTGVSSRGRTIACDMVVLAAGFRPNVDLAVLSGLPVERAIVVDDAMRVQDEEDIYALGECVQHRGEVLGSVAPVWEQAAVVAARITGTDASAVYLGSKTRPSGVGEREHGAERAAGDAGDVARVT